MQRMTIENTERTRRIPEPPSYFGLNDDELEILSEYGCLGHFLENDDWNGKKWFDETCFAILLKAIDHGMKEFTIKIGHVDIKVGNSRLVHSYKWIKQKDDDIEYYHRISLTLEGRKMRFKAGCQLMNTADGFERKSFGFYQTDSNLLYEQSFLRSEIPGEEPFFDRYHVTLIN